MKRVIAAVVLVVAMVGSAGAQEPCPSRPITIVAPFPPGGVVDLTARPLVAVIKRIGRVETT